MNPDKKIDHPVSIVVGFVVNWSIMLLVMAVIFWLGTSFFVPRSYLAWTLTTERSVNARIESWALTESHQGYAHRIAMRVTERINPLVESGRDPTELTTQRRQADIRSGADQESGMAHQLNMKFRSFVDENVWPVQVYYMPLYVSRMVIVMGLMPIFLCLFVASFFHGQRIRRERQKTGALPKAHRFLISRNFGIFSLSLLFAYPFIPIPSVNFIVIPIIAGMACYGIARTSANMVDF